MSILKKKFIEFNDMKFTHIKTSVNRNLTICECDTFTRKVNKGGAVIYARKCWALYNVSNGACIFLWGIQGYLFQFSMPIIESLHTKIISWNFTRHTLVCNPTVFFFSTTITKSFFVKEIKQTWLAAVTDNYSFHSFAKAK